MKFKLDGNLGRRTQDSFRNAGHDVETVSEEKLCGASDERLFEACCAGQRCLVSLDLDFSDPLRFPPERCAGIVILRVPRNPSLAVFEMLVRQLLAALKEMPFNRGLWIVEPGRIRVHQQETE
jgi:predicted nuclease of predicted toxin-antitoxin system